MEFVPRVYRVEDSEGRGPYIHNSQMWQVEPELHTMDYGRPAPHCERWRQGMGTDAYFSWENDPEAVFGFTNKRALRRWFSHPEEVAALSKMGFRVGVYEPATVWRAQRQAVFLPKRKIGEFDLTALSFSSKLVPLGTSEPDPMEDL